MKRLKITITKTDLLRSNFTDPWSCPIAKALRRANTTSFVVGSDWCRFTYMGLKRQISIKPLSTKVLRMMKQYKKDNNYYGKPLKPRTFSYTLNF